MVDDELWRRITQRCDERDYSGARAAVDEAYRFRSHDPAAVVLRAYVELAERHRRAARRSVEEFLATRSDAETLLLAVWFFQKLGDHDAVILYARRAARLSPDDPLAWRYLAQGYSETRRRPRAVAAARRAVALAPASVEDHLVLASALDLPPLLGSPREASEQVAVAASLAPGDPRPHQLVAERQRTRRYFWIALLLWVGFWEGQYALLRLGHGGIRLMVNLAFLVVFVTAIVAAPVINARLVGQTLRERIRTTRARAREDDAGTDGDLRWFALRNAPPLTLVPLLAIGTHTVAAAVGAPFPWWTVVFPLAGTALVGAATWWLIDRWLGRGTVRRAFRLSEPLRRQLKLAAGLVTAGAALLAVGVSFPQGLWTVLVLALITWGFGGMFTLAWRNRDTPQELS